MKNGWMYLHFFDDSQLSISYEWREDSWMYLHFFDDSQLFTVRKHKQAVGCTFIFSMIHSLTMCET